MFENEFATLETPLMAAHLAELQKETERNISARTKTAGRHPIAMLGVAFDNLTMREALARIEEMIASREPHYVVTANVDFLVRARRDVELQRVLLDAPLVLCDGTPLVWASRMLGNPLQERVAGADLVPELIKVAAKKNYKIFFLGTTEECCAQAVANVHKEFPELQIDHYSPPFRKLLEMNNAEIFRRIRAAQPDIVLVAFGCPKAEKWMAMHHRSLGVPVMIGVGATIDFLAGHVKRAPMWMRHTGLEWVFRLSQEPRRLFQRYATDLWWFGAAMLLQLWKMPFRRAKKSASENVPVITERTWQRIEISERFDFESVCHSAPLWERIVSTPRHCLLDMRAVKAIDSTGLGTLAYLQKKIHTAGKQFVLISPSRQVRLALELMQWEHAFDTAEDALAARELIASRENDAETVVALRKAPLLWQGEITSLNAVQILQRTLDAMLRATGEPWVIDLGAVRFMDSSGAKLMLHAEEYARRWKIRLHFRNASEAVRNVLRADELDYLLDRAA